jgi:hypothetical protein
MVKLPFLVIGFVLLLLNISFAQEKQRVKLGEDGATIQEPAFSTKVADTTGIIEFAGDSSRYGTGASYFLSSIRIVPAPEKELEAYMQRPSAATRFQRGLIASMKNLFPDIQSLSNSFTYSGKRPTVQGTFSFTSKKKEMLGRYMIVFVREQSALYTFTWTSDKAFFEVWDKASEAATNSLDATHKSENGLET